MTLAAIAIWPEFLEMLETRDFFGIPGIFTAPWWPIKLVIFLSAVLCAILFALKVVFPQRMQVKRVTSADKAKSISKNADSPGSNIS